MNESIVPNIRKKLIGRPPVGAIPVLVRIPPKELLPIDNWISDQKTFMSRPEAIRRLVEIGLTAARPSKSAAKPGRRSRAAELATNTIESIIDSSAPPDERDQRRQRLTRGPPEFREDRMDLPKAKK